MRHNIIINMPLTLLFFLIKERVLSKFLSNAIDCYERTAYYIMVYDLFESYFSWRYTEEGYEYWKNLRDKYIVHDLFV